MGEERELYVSGNYAKRGEFWTPWFDANDAVHRFAEYKIKQVGSAIITLESDGKGLVRLHVVMHQDKDGDVTDGIVAKWIG